MKTPKGTIKETPMMYETENDIPKAERAELNTLINQRLADLVDLQMQLKQAHWNVKGPHFIGLHELCDKIAEEVEPHADLIAERTVQLGGIAGGTVREAAARSPLEEYPLDIADALNPDCAIQQAVTRSNSELVPVAAARRVPVVWSDCFWTPKISHPNDSGPAFVTHSAFGEGAP